MSNLFCTFVIVYHLLFMNISIPDNLYDAELKSWARNLSLVFPNNEEVTLISKVIHAHIDDTYLRDTESFIGNINLSEEERIIIDKNNWLYSNNIEVRARFTDLMLRFIRGKDKLTKMKSCSDDYIAVAKCSFTKQELIDSHEYLIRGVRVRVIKQLYDKDFTNSIGNAIIEFDVNPIRAYHIIRTLIGNISEEQRHELLEMLNTNFENRSTDDLEYKDKFIEFLQETNQVSKEEYSLRKALNYECMAITINANKEPNTFYPAIQDYYQKAFKYIVLYKSKYIDDYNRIKESYEAASKESTEMLMKCGVPIKYSCDEKFCEYVDKQMSKVVIHNSADYLRLFIDAPLVASSSKLVKRIKSTITQYDIIGSMASTIHYDDKGHIIGKDSMDEYPSIEAHKHLRPNSLYYLVKMMQLFKEERVPIDEELIETLLINNKPSFVDEEDIIFWKIAIQSALKDDYITASHVIMPQLEKVLRFIASTKVDVVHLENERQDDHNIFEVLTDLEPFMNDELNNELKYFLTTGTDVNFRNRLMHGLIKPFEIEKYGPYLICISLKLYFVKDFFETPI